MTKRDVEEKVNHAFTSNVPDVLSRVLSECGDQNGRIAVMTDVKSKGKIFKWTACVAAAAVLVVMSVLGINLYRTNYNVASVVSLDVNPSIEIKTNINEKILEVNPLNDDGRIVIGDMSFKGSTLDVTINALIGSMLRNGYLNDTSNSILVSVYGDNSDGSSALQEKLSNEISTIIKEYNTFSGAVLSQTVSPDSDLRSLAELCGISLGKASLINQVVGQKPQYTAEDLAGLSINELNLMSEVNGLALGDVQSVGTASDKAYIGIDKARETAFADAGVTLESGVSKLEIEMDYEHGIMVYEVEFRYNDRSYDYEIDAVTGNITKSKNDPANDKDKDKLPSDNDNSSTPSAADIGADKAKEIAFTNAGVPSENDISRLELKTDYEHGVNVYEISFFYNNYKFEYEISAATGDILEAERNPSSTPSTAPSAPSSTDIGSDKAKQTALSHAGVPSESAVSWLEVEMEHEHGVLVYEIKFHYNDYKFEYKINAATGEILQSKSYPVNGKKPSGTSSSENSAVGTPSANIGSNEAKQIAFMHAGVSSESSVSKLEIETDHEHGALVYEISFKYNGYEFEYEIDAATGEILDYDMDD